MQNLFTGQFWLRIMRFTLTQLIVAVLFLSISHAHKMHAQELLNQRLTLSFESAEIKKVLQRIEKTTNVQFMYSSNVLQNTRRVSLAAHNERLADVLESLLTPLEVAYEVAGNRILLKKVKAEKTTNSPKHLSTQTSSPPSTGKYPEK